MKWFLKIISMLLMGLLLTSCDPTTHEKGSLAQFIPKDASVVFKIENFETLQSDLNNNDFLSEFRNSDSYSLLKNEASILRYMNPIAPSLLCISKVSDSTLGYTFISKQAQGLFVPDSIQNIAVERLQYDKLDLQKVTIDNKTAFITIMDSIFIASSSQTLLTNILTEKSETNPSFKKLYEMNTTADLTAIVKNPKVPIRNLSSHAFASYASMNLQVVPEAFSATGVIVARDTTPQLLSVFKGQIPQTNDLAKIIPTTSRQAISFTFSDAEKFQRELITFRKENDSVSTTSLFGSIDEVGIIELQNGKSIALKSIDPELTKESLARYISENGSYREVVLHSFSEPELFTKTFRPLVENIEVIYCFQLDNFFVFTESESDAQKIITDYKNNNTLAKMQYFEDASAMLSTSSSLLFYELNGTSNTIFSDFFAARITSQASEISTKGYPLSALQFSYDRDFAHVNYICKKATSEKQESGTVSEKFNISLDNEIMGLPKLFTNHRTKGKDAVVQDINNVLYFISDSGKILWNKKLDSAILGEIQEIDILRNGKKQLAFATKNNFYVLDRTGNAVAPFPIKFKDEITQPLSVFDYDNNRKYRFIITQREEVYMYNNEGKIVKGFTFKKAKSKIVLPPQHIRMSNKDYIIIAEENGKLNILSRTGKSRVTVNKTFSFSEIPVMNEDGKFVVITKDLSKESITQSGKVSSQKLNVANNYGFVVQGRIKATLDDNLLRINGKLIELPFGIYTAPQLFNANKTTYISVTETQENKVYLYDGSGTLVSGFPVYGTAQVHIADASQRGSIQLLVKGDPKELILYQWR